MDYSIGIQANNLTESEANRGIDSDLSDYFGYTLGFLAQNFPDRVREELSLDNIDFCCIPDEILSAKELDTWEKSGRNSALMPTLWKSDFCRHPGKVADTFDKIADRIEAGDAVFDYFVDMVLEAQDPNPMPDEAEQELLLSVNRPVAVDYFRRFAQVCRRLAENGTTKIVGFLYY